MGRTVRVAAVVTTALAAAAGAERVHGGESERGGFDLALTTQQPGAVTGLDFHLRYTHPDDPEAKPPPLTGATFDLADGLAVDDSAVPRCDATDEEFRAQGRGACPVASRVGEGTLVADTGVPGASAMTADIVAFNGDGQVIEVVFLPGTNVVAGMDRLTIEDGKLVAHPPSTPGGPPDGRTTIREIRLRLAERVGPDGRPYITTPPVCARGTWVSRATYSFADGGGTKLRSAAPCERPTLALAVRPRRLRAGRAAVLRVAVRSADRRCIAGAGVRLAGRSVRTGPGGRARLRVRLARPGVRDVVASKRGCEPARATVRVVAG